MDLFKDLRYAGHFTGKGKRVMLAGVLLLVAAGTFVGGLLLDPRNVPGLLSGFLTGLAVTIATTAVTTYQDNRDGERQAILRLAERDLLHERLNDLAEDAGVPTLDAAAGEVDQRVNARAERIAHFSGLDEHRSYFLRQ